MDRNNANRTWGNWAGSIWWLLFNSRQEADCTGMWSFWYFSITIYYLPSLSRCGILYILLSSQYYKKIAFLWHTKQQQFLWRVIAVEWSPIKLCNNISPSNGPWHFTSDANCYSYIMRAGDDILTSMAFRLIARLTLSLLRRPLAIHLCEARAVKWRKR